MTTTNKNTLFRMCLFNAMLIAGACLIVLGGYYWKSIYPMIVGWVLIILGIIFMLFCLNYHIDDTPDFDEHYDEH